jgi:Cu+-exporting ATPase
VRAAGPVVDPVPCSGCGKLIDPLRAGHVAIFDLRFHFFCHRGCRAAFLGEEGSATPAPSPTEARAALAAEQDKRRAEVEAPILPAFSADIDPVLPDAPPRDDDPNLVEPFARTILHEDPSPAEGPPEARDVGALLLVMAVFAGALAVALTLAGDTRLVILARVVLAAAGAAMLLGRVGTTPRDAVDPHPAPAMISATGALLTAVWAALGKDRALGAEAASLAGLLVTAAAVSAWLAESSRRQVSAERAYIGGALVIPGRRVDEDGEAAKRKVFDLRPGEQVVVDVGELVPVDLMVTGGDVEVHPWLGATTAARRRDGDSVVAGARVVRGKLRGVCTWSGHDRAFARTLLDPRRRADAMAHVSQASRALAERWAIVAAIIGAASAILARRNPIEVAMTAFAVHAALCTPVIASIASTHVARGILLGLRRGIIYKSADAWDRAGRAAVAMFCARGTLLLGEPELAELEASFGKLSPSDVLALAAGAERTGEHPIASAIVRAAKTRGVRPDGVRNPVFHAGLGVTAVTSSGEELCVGNRTLMFDQRVSIAAAEQRIAELEALGRTVVLVAVSSRLVGLLALQDGLRPGARAAVQHLLDAQIEPVLLAGDARETCEAIGRSLDIDHIRPEVLPADRGLEVRRLIEAGMGVAVLGHASVDELALGAADVAVALRAAGSTPGDFAVTLASDDVRDGALSLALAHKTRLEARVGLGIAVVPALVGAGIISFGILPPAYAPLASLLGGVMAVAHARRGVD